MEGTAAALRVLRAADADPDAGRVHIDLAGPGDEPELRRLLRDNPMPGAISLSLEREPDYFAAGALEGERHRVIVARDSASGRLLGAGSRSVRECFVDGRPVLLPYLAALRVDRLARRRPRLLAGGYALCRRLQRADEAPYALTSVAADNRAARRILGAGVPGLPTYREVEPFVTLAIPTSGRAARNEQHPWRIERGSLGTLEEIVACLERDYRRCQFAPRWTREELVSPERVPGLRLHDFHVARCDGQVVGCLAVWDQRGFKQSVVRGYAAPLRRLRPLVNLAAPWLGLPRLPAPGAVVQLAYLSHVAVGGDPGLLRGLMESARRDARGRGCDLVVLGLSARDPTLAVIRRSFRHRSYCSVLYLVHWEDGAAAVSSLGDRLAHVEVATL